MHVVVPNQRLDVDVGRRLQGFKAMFLVTRVLIHVRQRDINSRLKAGLPDQVYTNHLRAAI